MLQAWNAWFESVRFACEVHSVMSLRLVRMAHGGPQAAAEVRRMFSEKLDAFADAGAAFARASANGENFMLATERAYIPLRRCVRANSRRLVQDGVIPWGSNRS